MIIIMNPSVKKVAEFMIRELEVTELRGVAEALAITAPAIWAKYPKHEIQPLSLEEPSIT